jgi:coatomer subunit beta'
LYTIDKNFNIYTYSLLLSVVNYQAAIMNGNFEIANNFFKEIPELAYSKLSKFLEAND